MVMVVRNYGTLIGVLELEHFLFFHLLDYWEESSQLTNIFGRG